MDQRENNSSEDGNRVRLFSRAGDGDESTGITPTLTTTPVPPPIPIITTSPPPPITTTANTVTESTNNTNFTDSIPSNLTTTPRLTIPTTTTTSPPTTNTATEFTNANFTDSFFNIPSDARSEMGGNTPESIPDVNAYQNKKTVAQGMMDLALFSANANQLRYVMESQEHPYFWAGVVLISISLILQVGVGIGLLLNTRYNVKDKKEICIANKINNFTIVGIFLVTVINVFISAFGVASGVQPPAVSIGPRFGNSSDLNSDLE